MNLTEPHSQIPARSRWVVVGEFWWNVFLALQRVLAFIIFALGDHYVGVLLAATLPKEWDAAKKLSEELGFLFLMVVQLYLGYDMVAVFIPRLKQWETK